MSFICVPYNNVYSNCLLHAIVPPYRMKARSVTMDLDLFLGGDALVDEELEDVTSVVSLELDDVAPLAVLGGCAIAAPRLFEVSRYLFHVEVLGKASHGGQALASISLLEV